MFIFGAQIQNVSRECICIRPQPQPRCANVHAREGQRRRLCRLRLGSVSHSSLFAHIPPFIRFSTSESPFGWRLPPQLQQLVNVSYIPICTTIGEVALPLAGYILIKQTFLLAILPLFAAFMVAMVTMCGTYLLLLIHLLTETATKSNLLLKSLRRNLK